MKKRRFTSILMAVCMLMATAIPAGAAHISNDSQLSAYAGTTAKCQLVKMSDSGEAESVFIDVAIPEGATQAEGDAMIKTALMGEMAAAASTEITPRGILDSISLLEDVTVNTSYASMGSGTVPYADAVMLLVVFSDYWNYGASEITVNVTGGMYATGNNTMTAEISTASNIIAFMYTGEGRIFLTNGASVAARAKTDAGRVEAETCNIYVSSYDLNGG